MIQLLYASKASDLFRESSDLPGILRISASNNAARGVTGLLLYTNGTFMQVLEGEAADIDRLMIRIRADKRHQDVNILIRTSISHREFGRWSMGFRRGLNRKDAESLPEYAPYFEDGFDLHTLSRHPDITLDILRALVEQADAGDFNTIPESP